MRWKAGVASDRHTGRCRAATEEGYGRSCSAAATVDGSGGVGGESACGGELAVECEIEWETELAIESDGE